MEMEQERWKAGDAKEERMSAQSQREREKLEGTVMGFGGMIAAAGAIGGYAAAPLALMTGAIAMPMLLPAMGASAAVGVAGMAVYFGAEKIADKLIKRREGQRVGAEPSKDMKI